MDRVDFTGLDKILVGQLLDYIRIDKLVVTLLGFIEQDLCFLEDDVIVVV